MTVVVTTAQAATIRRMRNARTLSVLAGRLTLVHSRKGGGVKGALGFREPLVCGQLNSALGTVSKCLELYVGSGQKWLFEFVFLGFYPVSFLAALADGADSQSFRSDLDDVTIAQIIP